jgi:uncharacterized protein
MKGPTLPIAFEWDGGNREKNWTKHKAHYKEAEEVFFNKPLVLLKDTKHSQTEERFIALGVTNHKRKLILTYTIRNKMIRIISARDQSKKERRIYGKK